MPDTDLARYAGIFASRLETLARLLDLAEAQWRESGREPEALCAARLADDMLPLPYQIVFACNQSNDFATWCRGEPGHRPDAATLPFAALKSHVAAAIEATRQSAQAAAGDVLASKKRIDLGAGATGMYVELPGRRYVEDWLLPNFYFHLVTAYDILRHAGVKIGKADFMAHLAGDVRRA